ncbi:MAG: response regulator [Saprospiraceae bacterium]|nr:response regulator [Bacteroidia bacterium]NNE14681.1 response regulator [Saprospiraceae bacterium]NNL93914.1 response regulator [Saprospiraceae bacterium]
MKKILVIEDNNEVRENLCEILELSGYKVFEAENGVVGVNKTRELLPDLIICDVMMPELDGFGVLKILNKSPELMHIPFMFLTAKVEKQDFRKGMGLGADDYITKPFDDVELIESIEIRLKKAERLRGLDNSEAGVRQLFNAAKGEEELKKLSEDRELRKYQKKDIIYEVNNYPNWLYFVVSGQIKCFKINDFGKELITHIYGPGDFFGFLPLLTDGKYEDSTVVLEDAEISMIPPEDFKLLLFNNRDFAAKFISMLAHHADYNEKQLLNLAYSSVRKKVANALIAVVNKSVGNKIDLRREDLASLAGTAKETTIRTISDFKSEGFIEIQNGKIEVVDIKALENIPQ